MEAIKKLSEALRNQGATSFFRMSRKFRQFDTDGSRTLDLAEFTNGVRQLDVPAEKMSDAEIKAAFETLDVDGSGTIDVKESMKAVTPPMSEARLEMVRQAFAKLDKTGDGIISAEDMKGVYNAKGQPEYISGEKTEEQLLTELLNKFELGGESRDAKVTLDEFEKYYAGTGESINDDDMFLCHIQTSWGL